MKSYVYAFLLISVFMLTRCGSDDGPNEGQLVLQTSSAVPTSSTSSIFMASLSNAGAERILAYGFVYGPSEDWNAPETQHVKVADGQPLSVFQTEVKDINNPVSGKLYVAAYITTTTGTIYGNTLSFTLPTIAITAFSPTKGKAGDRITITVSGADLSKQAPQVKFNSKAAKVVETTGNKVVVEVPSGIDLSDSYNARISVSSGISAVTASEPFQVLFSVKDFSPRTGVFGALIEISPDNIPVLHTANGLAITVGGIAASFEYFNNKLVVTMPPDVKTERLKIAISFSDGNVVNLPEEFIITKPVINAFSAATVYPGQSVSLSGENFPVTTQATVKAITVKIGETPVTDFGVDVDSRSLRLTVPKDVAPGNYTVTISTAVYSVTSSVTLTVLPYPITRFTPQAGTVGTVVVLEGAFGANPEVAFHNIKATIISATANRLEVRVPQYIPNALQVKVRVVMDGMAFDAPERFVMIPLIISSFTPASGKPGSIVEITGGGFSPVANYNSVNIGGANAEVLSATSTTLRVRIDASAIAGPNTILVSTNLLDAESSENFTVLE